MKQKDVYELAHNVKDRQSFLEFIEALKNEFRNNPESFENCAIDNFLDAIQAWVHDKHKWQIANNKNDYKLDNPDWMTIASMFLAGKIYE